VVYKYRDVTRRDGTAPFMIVLRIVGWLLVLAALIVAGREAVAWFVTGHWTIIPAGQVWAEIHRESLLLAQPAIERHVLPELWTAIFAVLQWPAWAALGVPGLFLLGFARWRRWRRKRS
jgi:hypothetical protein